MLINSWRAAIVCVLVALPALAASTKFVFKQVAVNGSFLVQVNAINNKNQYAGSYLDNNGSHAFLVSAGVATLLAPGQGCSGVTPAVLNLRAAILGFVTCSGAPGAFLWANGIYNPDCCGALGMPDPDYHVGLNAGGVVFLNTASGGGNGWLLGTPLNLAPVYPPGVDAEICSINTGAVVAGVTTSSGGAPMFFYGGGAGFTQFAPPAMAATSGCAFINDTGRIAGSYLDSAGAPQGFVYAGGALVYFGMPGQVESLAVDAYSNKGRAVGSYFDPINQLWHLFWYNGSVVSVFGSFLPQTNLRLALNDNGILMLAVRRSNGGPTASYRILCAGDAC